MYDTVSNTQIGTPNPHAADSFYGQLFKWAINQPDGGGYTMIGDYQEPRVFFAQTPDILATINHAVALGATVAHPPIDNGDIEFAHLHDPHGNRFGIWQPK
ncbi:VOC family protein [Mycobacterium sp. CBMA271]|nr:VOC family protein [Mycobacteroides sp. CBMA 326]MUM18627.1 hypothetical protein [Mycobacteroides sp. CBMA 326]MUM22589.1 VOC family protein [Mycobacteroides sp. CBMA 271]